MRIKFYFLCLLLTLPLGLHAQQTITGRVLDGEDSSFGLPGVSVQEKGTSNGNVTNGNGEFSLTVAGPESVLVFSFVGYITQEIKVGNQTTINLTLQPDVVALAEVVVVGYGQQEKGDVTGVIEAISSEDFNKGAIVSADNLISGKVAGVQISQNSGEPGGQTSIRIRGGTSVNASNEPLFVIDGVPIDNSAHNPGGFSGGRNPLNFLNPNDIETMTVLKDASATAIYGSRGANGVIIITTKKGQAGQAGRISYDAYFTWADFSTDFQNLGILDAPALTNVVIAKAPSRLETLGGANTNWFDEVTQAGFGQSHSLSFTGGGDNMGYRASLGYQDLEGVLQSSRTQRTSLSLNFNQRLLDDALKINANIKAAFTDDQFAPGVVGTAYAFDPTQPVFDANSPWGGYFEYTNDLAPDNPVSAIDQTTDLGESVRNIGNVEFDYTFPFLEGLSAKLNLGYDITNGKRQRFQPSTLRNQSSDNGEVRIENVSRQSALVEAYVNYKTDIGNDQTIDLTGGYSFQTFQSEFPRLRAWDLSTDIFGLGSTSPASELETGNVIEENRLISFFGRVNYALKDRYLLTATVRRDGSSRFGFDNRWGIFPSAALAWRIMDEPFAAALDNVFSNLKFRVGWGITGNQEIGNNRFLATFTQGDGRTRVQFGNQFISTLRPNAYDPNLKWEETSSLNIGLDFGVLEGRLNGSLEYYQKTTQDLLFEVSVASGANLSNIVLTNIGELENSGIELSLDATLVDNDDLRINLGGNMAFNRNEITRLNNSSDPGFLGFATGGISGGVGNTIQILRVGESVNSFFVFKHLRDENGNPLADGVDHNNDGSVGLADIYEDTNGDGIVNDNDKIIMEQPAGDLTFGISPSVFYKDFDLTMTMRGSVGNYVYNNVASNYGYFNRVITENVVTNMHASALVTNFNAPQYFSDYYVEDASFLRMDNITLGYRPKLTGSKYDLRLYVTAQNLFVLTNYTGLDPEVPNGIDNNLYPRSRNYIFGLSLTF